MFYIILNITKDIIYLIKKQKDRLNFVFKQQNSKSSNPYNWKKKIKLNTQ